MAYKVGIIGLGIMGQRMANGMIQHPLFEVSAGWDLNSQVGQQVQRDLLPGMDLAADAQSLLANPHLDLIYIATPPTTHLAYSRSAMEVGKPIFCEKPLAVDLAASRALVAELETSGVPNAVNFPFAASQEIATLEKRLHAGQHGKSRLLEMRFHFSEWPRTWQRDAASWLSGRVEGGFLREVFSHFAYLTLRILETVEIISADVIFPHDGTTAETYVMATLASKSLSIQISGGVGGAAPDYNEWTLYGTEKSYRFYDWRLLKVGDPQGWQELSPDIDPKPFLGDQLDALANMLAGKPHPLPDFSAALAVQELVEGLLSFSESTYVSKAENGTER